MNFSKQPAATVLAKTVLPKTVLAKTVLRALGLVLVAALAATACGSASLRIGGEKVEDAAVELIEGELAEQLDLDMAAACPPVVDPQVGTEFECTAETAGGETVRFAGVVDREDHINVETTNVINGSSLSVFETEAARLLTEQVGVDVTVECGEGTKVLDDQQELDCEASDGNDTRAAKLKITDAATAAFTIRLV